MSINKLGWTKPTTDVEWAKDVEQESLNVKFDYQLVQMLSSLQSKEIRIDSLTIDPELQEQFNIKSERIARSILRIQNEQRLRSEGFVWVNKNDPDFTAGETKKDIEPKPSSDAPDGAIVRIIRGTTYYIDADNGDDANDGSDPSSMGAWATLDQFTENTRSAGDIAILRRGTTATYDLNTSLTFTSDGALGNPIVVEADYDDNWTTETTTSQTYTLVLGSKTATASATISDLSVGDWVYNTTDGDDQRKFAYEVAAVSGTTLTLFLPFKGTAGATKTLQIMGAAPKWGAGGATAQVTFANDGYWRIQGLHIYSSHPNGQIYVNSASYDNTFIDMIVAGNQSSSIGAAVLNSSSASFFKTRFLDYDDVGIDAGGEGLLRMKDCLMDGKSLAGTIGIQVGGSGNTMIADCLEFVGNAVNDIDLETSGGMSNNFIGRNVIVSAPTPVLIEIGTERGIVSIQDYDGTVGDTRYWSNQSSTTSTPIYQSDTGTVRSGGGTPSIKMIPSTYIGEVEWGRVILMDLPVYTDTSSKTYTIYFKSNATADWTANPTATQLYLEASYYADASTAERTIIKSTGTVNFTGLTTWQSIGLTLTPAQAGLLSLRVVYAKPKETSKSNEFYVDPVVVIS